MVAFSRITFALTVAGLSSAQSFSVSAPSGPPSEFPSGAFPFGSARPTGGYGGPGGHGGDHSSFAHPTDSLHSGGSRPDFSGAVIVRSAQQSGSNAPFPTGSFSAFLSDAAKPSGHHGLPSKGDKGGKHSIQESGKSTPPTVTGLERRQQPSSTHVAFSGFPVPPGGLPSGRVSAPSDGFPSGRFPESGAPFPTVGGFSAFPSGVAKPSGHHNHGGKGGGGGKHSRRPSGNDPTVSSSVASGVGHHQQPSDMPMALSGTFHGLAPSGPKPTDQVPSGVAPPKGSGPSGRPSNPNHSNTSPVRPSVVQNNISAAAAVATESGKVAKPTGIKPTGARPTGIRPSEKLSGTPSKKPSAAPSGLRRHPQRSGFSRPSGVPSAKHTGARPSGIRPSSTPPGAHSQFNIAAQSGTPAGTPPSGEFGGPAPSGARPTGSPPSGKPGGPAPTGFFTSSIRGV